MQHCPIPLSATFISTIMVVSVRARTVSEGGAVLLCPARSGGANRQR